MGGLCCKATPLLSAYDETTPLLDARYNPWRDFLLFTTSFSCNHAAVTTTLALSGTVLGTSLAGTGNALLFVFYGITAGLTSFGVIDRFGPTRACSIGMCLYCFYVGFYTWAQADSQLAHGLVVVGGILGGISAGILWAAQGAYVARVTNAFATFKGIESEQASGKLAGLFAAVYLAAELSLKVTSAVWSAINDSAHQMMLQSMLFTAVSAVFALLSFQLTEAPPVSDAPPLAGGLLRTLLGALELLRDDPISEATRTDSNTCRRPAPRCLSAPHASEPRRPIAVALLAPFNFTFGFISSLMVGTVTVASASALGTSSVGFLTSIIAATAAATALLCGSIKWCQTHKTPMLILGTAAFALELGLIVFLVSATPPAPGEGAGAWWLLNVLVRTHPRANRATWAAFAARTFTLRVPTPSRATRRTPPAQIYTLHGVGRGTFESVNKGLTVDYFPHRAPAAFANIIFQNSLSSALGFLLFPRVSAAVAIVVTGATAALATPALLLAARIRGDRRTAEVLGLPGAQKQRHG